MSYTNTTGLNPFDFLTFSAPVLRTLDNVTVPNLVITQTALVIGSNTFTHTNVNMIGNGLVSQFNNSCYISNIRNVTNLLNMNLSYNPSTKEITQEPKFVVIDIHNANYNFDTIDKVLAMRNGIIVSSTKLTAGRIIILPTQALLISAFGSNLSGLNFKILNTRQSNGGLGITFQNPVNTATVKYGICLNVNNLFTSNQAVLLTAFFYYDVSMDWNSAITGNNSTGQPDQNVFYTFTQLGKRQ